jgi:hypothetical protein
MIKDGYILRSPVPKRKNDKHNKEKTEPSVKANWDLLQKDKIWVQP